MGKNLNILFDIINIWAKENELYSVQGSVSAVDEGNRTCTVTPTSGGADILNVRLEADYTVDTATDPKGFFVVPTVGSLVVVSFLSKEDAFISAWTGIDKVIATQVEWIFNDGVNGGLTKLQELTDRLNEYEALFTQLKTDFNTWVPVPSDGGTALKAVLGTGFLTNTVPSSDKTDFENDKIKH